MSRTGQVVGMAGAVLAAQQALAIARTGRADPPASALVIGATLKIDSESVADIYGGTEALRPALVALRDFMLARERDRILVRTLIVLMQVERNFAARPDMAIQVAEGIRGAAAFLETNEGPPSSAVPRLGDLYALTISKLTPRVMIPGDPELLARESVVAAVRAHLLAALRGVVLWRQMGGSRVGLLFGWRALRAECGRLLAPS